ncbi:MAG: hypothetical protein EB082_00715 [Verrucomicrobia bacterium]|nr:hypothetical protein [Verrucomicrobiota bacterium]NDE96673.1 hypothetical protein [Verrucomicrobiota bacterium]
MRVPAAQFPFRRLAAPRADESGRAVHLSGLQRRRGSHQRGPAQRVVLHHLRRRVRRPKKGAQVATLGPGDFCGEISLLQGTAASADVAAIRNSRCLKLGKESFLQLISRDFLTGIAIERTSDRRVVELRKKGGAQ